MDQQAPSPDFDVVCVGCGPSGNLAAYLLARAGWRVLLLERSALPRLKVCGGGLSARALALLPYAIDAVVHQHMQGARLTLAGRLLGDIASPGIGVMIERAEFDAFMTAQAVAAGAQVWDEAALVAFGEDAKGVWLTTTRGPVRCRLLIGADGARSAVRALLYPHWRPEFAFGIEAHYRWAADSPPAATPSDRALFDFGALDQGYGWIFPKRGHFNVGIYRIRKSPGTRSLKQALDSFEALHPALASCARQSSLGHPIPLSNGCQPVGRGRVILIGDAAGLGEAFLGEGIAFALHSAKLAAAWADQAMGAGAGVGAMSAIGAPAANPGRDGAGFQPAQPWSAALRPVIEELRHSLRMARVLYLLPRPWLQRAASAPSIQHLIVALLHGRRSYRQTWWRLLVALPGALLRPVGRQGPPLPAEVRSGCTDGAPD